MSSYSIRLQRVTAVVVASLGATLLVSMNLVRTTTKTEDAVAKYGVTGKGVTIAIVDRGIDWRHPDFIKPDGTTRIKWLLDMSGQQGCGDLAPVEYSEAQINSALRGGPPILSDDYVGHGTVTAGLASGNGRAFANGKYHGMAPEADLIIVKAAGGAPAHGLIPAEPTFLGCFDDALAWIVNKIRLLGQPAVATFNFGTQWGPMDGTDQFSRKVDAAFGLDNPGHVFVAPPGDEGGIPDHAGGQYTKDTVTIVNFTKSEEGRDVANLWYSGLYPAEITITFDDGTIIGPVGPGSSSTQDGLAVYQYDYWQSTSGDGAAAISFDKPAGSGQVRIHGLKSGQGTFDLYGTGTLTFTDHLVPGRLTAMAAIKSAIVPAVIVNRLSYVDIDGRAEFATTGRQSAGVLWENSPGGPSRDGRLGIDVGVPGQSVFAAYGQNSAWTSLRWTLIEDGGGWYGAGGGGSGAGPVMTGAVALMLQLMPSLTARQIKQILHETALSDSITGRTPNNDWGYGRLDMLSALDVIAGLKAQTTPRIAGVVNAASLQSPIQNDSWISIFGSHLSTSPPRSWANSDFANGTIPTDLDGVTVTVNGKNAALAYISSGQINALSPIDSTIGDVNVVVRNANGVSPAFVVSLQAFSPAFFTFGAAKKYAAATFPDGTYVATPGTFGTGIVSRSARSGDIVALYGTGFGTTDPPIPFGPLNIKPSPLASTVNVLVAGIPAFVQFAGVTSVGECQLNVILPAGIPPGDQPIVAEIGGRQSRGDVVISIME